MKCQGCGGSLSASNGQTIILPAVIITFDNAGKTIERLDDKDAWCGDCVDEWNTRMNFGDDPYEYR